MKINDSITWRPFTAEDADELFRLTDTSRETLREWLPWVDATTKQEHSLGFIEGTLKANKEETGLTGAVIYQGKLAGAAGFNQLDWANRVGYIGYWLAPVAQGNGVMTQVCSELVDYAFDTLTLNKVDIRAADKNRKSRAIPERLGFVKEGQIRQAEWLYDHYVDHVVYGMLKDEWIKR